MKIMFLYKYCILGGVTTQLANRLHFLKEFCEPHFAFVSNHGGTVAFNGYQHVVILETADEIASYMKKHDFSFVVTIDTYELYEAIEKIQYKGKVIHEVHTTYVTALEHLKAIAPRLQMDAVVTPSTYLMDIVKPFFTSHPNTIFQVVENCLDTELFQPTSVNQAEKSVLLWIGKLDAHKNWPLFLQFAAGVIQDKHHLYEVWMVGGHSASDEVKAMFHARVEELGLIQIFRWLPNVSYIEMPEVYSGVANSGGIYVSTSQNESFGMTLAEALACHCPVVAPRVGAIPEVMSGDVLSESLYEPNNLEDAISKARHLLEDNAFYKQNLQLGREKIVTAYGIDVTGLAYKKLLESIINN